MEKTTEFKQTYIEPMNYRLGMIRVCLDIGYTGIPPKLPLYGETWSQSIGIGCAQSERRRLGLSVQVGILMDFMYQQGGFVSRNRSGRMTDQSDGRWSLSVFCLYTFAMSTTLNL